MMFVPVPAGSWGLGPSLLFLLGVAVGVPLIDWWFGRDERRALTPDEVMERRKAEAFTRALVDAAKRR
jgi:hypothetical protein